MFEDAEVTTSSPSGGDSFAEALHAYPTLLLFVIPWTTASILALCYVQGGLLISFARTQDIYQLLVNLIGFALATPWMILAGHAACAVATTISRFRNQGKGLWSCFVEGRSMLDSWIPTTRTEVARMLGAILLWTAASFPFTLLVAELLEDNKLVIALFLSLLLTPYWSLALMGVYALIAGSVRQCQRKSHRHELLQLASITNSDREDTS